MPFMANVFPNGGLDHLPWSDLRTIVSGIVAWLLRWFVPDKYLQGANQRFVTLLGTKSFMRIIESVQISNPLKPRESQKERGVKNEICRIP